MKSIENGLLGGEASNHSSAAEDNVDLNPKKITMVLHPSTWYFILHPKVNHHRDQSKSEVHLKAGRRREGWKCIKEPNVSLINHSSLLLFGEEKGWGGKCMGRKNQIYLLSTTPAATVMPER